MDYILTTTNLTKTYGKKDAAKDINIHVREGDIYGLIGRNGAGKTTVMRMISGLSMPTSGTYQMNGENRFGVGVLIEGPGIYPNMSAAENIRLKCIAMNCNSKAYIDELLHIVGLENTENKHAGSFSLGMRQRLGIALALVGDPKMIVLDEPINGLDPQGIAEVRQTLERLRDEKGITIMISSHILDEFTTDELATRCGQYVTVKTGDNNRAEAVLRQLGLQNIQTDIPGELHIHEGLERTEEMTKALVQNGVGVREIFIKNTSLEDYYLSVTGGEHNG